MTVVINKAQFPKFVHEMAHTRSRRADHLRQVPWLIFAIIGSGRPSLPKFARSRRIRVSRFSLELNSRSTKSSSNSRLIREPGSPPVSGNLHRHLRREIRNNQCWPAVYRERRCGLGRAPGQCVQELYWSLVFGFCDRDDNESCGCGSCAIRAQADAEKACLLDEPQIVCRAFERSGGSRWFLTPTGFPNAFRESPSRLTTRDPPRGGNGRLGNDRRDETSDSLVRLSRRRRERAT